MRKTDKKSMKLSLDKSGVILVTIIFIVAMALVFITTALTITIAARQRVYSNAKSDQARLTVTSLAQSLWNAIYYQQINDYMLESLANGTGGSGTLVTFECSQIPGMTGDEETSATAYFYNKTKDGKNYICIECKCEIEGVAQYYTMVLEKNEPEGTPVSMFELTVDLGDGGQLCRGMFGFDVSGDFSNWNKIVAYNAADNVMFVHNPTWSGIGNMGFGSTVITDGMIFFQNASFNRDVYCVGAEAGINFGNSTIERPTGVGQTAGNFYFIGTDFPIRDNGISRPDADAGYSATNRFTGTFGQHFNNNSVGAIYMEYYNNSGTLEGYRDLNSTSTVQWQDVNSFPSWMTVNYDTGIFTTSWLSSRSKPAAATFNAVTSTAQHTSYVNQYINIEAGRLDTIQEIETQPLFAGRTSGGDPITSSGYVNAGHTYGLSSDDPITAGTYSISSMDLSGKELYFDVSGGPIFINVNGELKFGNNGYMIIEGSSNDNKVYFFIHDGGYIDIGGGGYYESEWGSGMSAGQSNCGIVDLRCFNQDKLFDTSDGSINSGDWKTANLNQADDRVPRCIIFSMYGSATRKYALMITGNGPCYLTAYLAFYYDDKNGDQLPNDSAAGGAPAWFGIYNCANGNQMQVIYGRISAGGITAQTGDYFGLPYCPALKNDDDVRTSAYRDNTDYSVVMDECYYFTQYTGT